MGHVGMALGSQVGVLARWWDGGSESGWYPAECAVPTLVGVVAAEDGLWRCPVCGGVATVYALDCLSGDAEAFCDLHRPVVAAVRTRASNGDTPIAVPGTEEETR